MPFKSEAQRRYLWMKEPKIAKKWADEYPNQKNLPMHNKEKKDEKSKPSPYSKLSGYKGTRS